MSQAIPFSDLIADALRKDLVKLINYFVDEGCRKDFEAIVVTQHNDCEFNITLSFNYPDDFGPDLSYALFTIVTNDLVNINDAIWHDVVGKLIAPVEELDVRCQSYILGGRAVTRVSFIETPAIRGWHDEDFLRRYVKLLEDATITS